MSNQNRSFRRAFARRAKQFSTTYGAGMSREHRAAVFVGACNLLRGNEKTTQATFNVLRVLLYDFLNLKTGACFPSHARIAEKANCSRDTVIEAMKTLEAVGILEWSHRLVRRCIEGVLRPQRSSNVYRFFSWFALKREPSYKSELPTGTNPSPFNSSSTDQKAIETIFDSWRERGLLTPSPS